MLRLNVNKEKKLTFEVQLGGIAYDQVDSEFVVEFDNVKYSFPGVVGRETVTVQLPILKSIIGKKIREGDEAIVKLKVVSDGQVMTPWKDRAILSNPIMVEAKIKDPDIIDVDDYPSQPHVIIDEQVDKRKETVKKEKETKLNEADITENILSKLSEKLDSIINNKSTVKEEKMDSQKHGEGEGTEQAGTGDKTISGAKKDAEKEIAKEQKMNSEEHAEGEGTDQLGTKNSSIPAAKKDAEKELAKESKKTKIENFKKNLTEDMIKKYLEKKGPKDERIRDLVFEQAKISAGKNASPSGILFEVYKILDKKE